eukprot:31546-Pelagococcus_subviridis.AAC.4
MSLPPMWLIAMYAACTAGPIADSTRDVSLNAPGSMSRSASTASLLSLKFTSRSSGAGTNGSSSSATTIICGCELPGFSA